MRLLIVGGALLVAVMAVVPVAQGHTTSPMRCPAKPLFSVPRNKWKPARQQLAPLGATAIRLCRYSGGNAHPPAKLIRSRLLTGRLRINSLIRDFNKLPPFGPGATSCPSDDGSQIDALLAYPNGERVTVKTSLTGCRDVTNGNLIRTAEGFGVPRQFGPQLITELKALTRPARAPR
ncbi:MAG: hypothetical protein ACR2QA_02725 [Solirubrobacteraceae bacterium]